MSFNLLCFLVLFYETKTIFIAFEGAVSGTPIKNIFISFRRRLVRVSNENYDFMKRV